MKHTKIKKKRKSTRVNNKGNKWVGLKKETRLKTFVK